MNEPMQTQTAAPAKSAAPGRAGGDHLHDALSAAQLPTDAAGGAAAGPPDGGSSQGEMSVYLLERLEQGAQDPLQGLGFDSRPLAERVWGIIEKNRALVDRCIQEGVDRVVGGGVERVKPAPPHAIASFLGLAPKDPTWRKPA